MKRLTNEEVRVDESMDRYLGPRSVLEGMKPKLLDLVLNGPVLNSVSKAALRQIIRQLYSALAAYEDTGLTPEEINDLASVREISPEAEYAINKHADNIIERLDKLLHQTDDDARLLDLAEADKDGRLVVLPCKVGEKLWVIGRDNVPREMELEPPDIRTVCTDEDNLCMSTCNRRPDGYCAYRLRNDGTSIGKTVFLTREEAEKALEAMKDG
jgi:hypothetical protein|nr:MAG TPA: hypothetical protein [Caudoviricetes sp.]